MIAAAGRSANFPRLLLNLENQVHHRVQRSAIQRRTQSFHLRRKPQPLRFQGRQSNRGRRRTQVNAFRRRAIFQAVARGLEGGAQALIALRIGNARREWIDLQDQGDGFQQL